MGWGAISSTGPSATSCVLATGAWRSRAGRRCGPWTAGCAPAAAATRSPAPACARAFPRRARPREGPAFRGAGSLGEVDGTLDAHGHLTAYEFIGGKFHCGKPFSEKGIADALPDCSKDRGPGGVNSPLQNILDSGSPVSDYDQVGYPTFRSWPSAHALTYEGTYWKWVERSWQSGLRMMVTLLVDNDVLCGLQANRVNSCDEMEGAKLQRQRLYEMQDYIDAQYGGPGKGFLRIVTDPYQARRVVAQRKLAVVMGMETSALFGCRGNDSNAGCDRAKIDRGLAEFRRLGIRSFFPVHKFDNPLGGTKMDGGNTGVVVNQGNKIAFGKYWDARTCTGAETDNTQSGNAGAVAGALAGTPLAGLISGQAPAYPPGPHCNSRGLTSLGRYLIGKLMDSKSIVEIDHMGAKSRNQTLDLLEQRRYSGVISAHTWASPLNYPRIYKLGGIVTPAAGSETAAKFVGEWQAYRKLRNKRFYFGFGYGSDTNGLAVQASPPEKPLSYPFTALTSKTKFDRQKTGVRTFDYNKEGVAHYGLYADWLADLRRTGGPQMAREMNRGAEAYLQMWERAEGILATRCRPGRAEVTSAGLLGRAPLGRSALNLLQRKGQPSSRPGAYYRWCVRRSRGAVTAAFNSRSRAVLVITTAGTPPLARAAPRLALAGAARAGQESGRRRVRGTTPQARRPPRLLGATASHRRRRGGRALARAQPQGPRRGAAWRHAWPGLHARAARRRLRGDELSDGRGGPGPARREGRDARAALRALHHRHEPLLRTPVGQDHDTVAGGLRVGQVEPARAAAILEQARPLALEHRVDLEAHLVEHISAQQGLDQRRAPVDADVPARLLLQLVDLAGEVALDERRVLVARPRSGLERSRDDVLGHAVDVAGEGLARRRGPVVCPLLVGDSTEQHGVLLRRQAEEVIQDFSVLRSSAMSFMAASTTATPSSVTKVWETTFLMAMLPFEVA